MGKPSRDKGARFEHEVVHILQDHGRAGERVPSLVRLAGPSRVT